MKLLNEANILLCISEKNRLSKIEEKGTNFKHKIKKKIKII